MKFYSIVSLTLYSTLSLSIALPTTLSDSFTGESIQFLSRILSQTLSQPPTQPQPGSGIEGGDRAWRAIFPNSRAPRTPRRGGGEGGDQRGDEDDQVCAIAPNYSETIQVWSDQPALTWIGRVTQVEIREPESRDALWEQKISDTNQVTLDLSDSLVLRQVEIAAPLQPGQTYRWYFSDKPSGAYDKYFPIDFKVMTAEQRAAVTQELQQLEQELTAQNITGDTAKLRRADYFAGQELWLDFWQEVLSIESPSEELKDLLSSTANQLCE